MVDPPRFTKLGAKWVEVRKRVWGQELVYDEANLKRGQQHPLQHRPNRNCLTPQKTPKLLFCNSRGRPAIQEDSDYGFRNADLKNAAAE